jgi:hypothetical protein
MKYIFMAIFSLGLTSCLSSIGHQTSLGELFEMSATHGDGEISGYYEHTGGQFGVFLKPSMEGNCISGRFETVDVQSGKTKQYAKYHGQKVTIVGDIQKSWDHTDEYGNCYTNVQNYCYNELVIVGRELSLY